MSLTIAQLETFATAINADSNLTNYIASQNAGYIANYYNGASATEIWNPSISIAQLNDAIVWSEFAGLTVALQNTYMAMTTGTSVDATNANIRNGFSTIFTGKTTLTNLIALAQRLATVFEALFTTANVCSLYGYNVSVQDVIAAMGWKD